MRDAQGVASLPMQEGKFSQFQFNRYRLLNEAEPSETREYKEPLQKSRYGRGYYPGRGPRLKKRLCKSRRVPFSDWISQSRRGLKSRRQSFLTSRRQSFLK